MQVSSPGSNAASPTGITGPTYAECVEKQQKTFQIENELQNVETHTPSKEEIETNEKNIARDLAASQDATQANKLGQLVFKLR